MLKRLTTALCAISLANVGGVLAVGAGHGLAHRRQHHSIARASFDEGGNSTTSLEPRAGDSKWSWYDTEESGNAGACGKHMKNYEFVVARAQVDFQQSDCFKTITLEFEGRTVQAQIMDICPVCPPRGLDLSKGLFKHIAPNGDGIVYGNWWFGGGAPKPPKPTTTKKPEPTTTTTKKPTSTTTTTTKKSTTTSTTTTSTSTTSSTTSTSSSTTASVAPPPTAAPQANLGALQEILVEMGGVVAAA